MDEPIRILGVDGSLTIRKTLEIVLAPAGYQLALAGSGGEALRKAQTFKPALVLLASVPDMTEATVCERLAQDPATTNVPIVLLTPTNGSGGLADRSPPNVVERLAKPFRPSAVTQLVADVLRRTEGGSWRPIGEERADRKGTPADVCAAAALAEVDRLKQSEHHLRAQLDTQARAARQQVDDARAAAARSRSDAEQLRGRNAELQTFAESARCRLADIETGNAIYEQELERLEADRTALLKRIENLQADADAARTHVSAVRDELAQLRDLLATSRAAEQESSIRTANLETALRMRQTEVDQLRAELEQLRMQPADERGQPRDAARRGNGEVQSVEVAATLSRPDSLRSGSSGATRYPLAGPRAASVRSAMAFSGSVSPRSAALGYGHFRKTAAAFLATKIAEIDPWLSPVESPSPRPSHLPKLGEVLAALRRPWKAAPPVTKPLGPVALVHLEENQALREPVSALLGTLPGAHYSNAIAEVAPPSATPVMAANLLNHDALAALSGWLQADTPPREVFAYCADGSHGFALPPAELIAPPIEPRVCAERLVKWCSGLQRVLVVSADMEWVAALRPALFKHGCVASAAFDTAQAIYLVSMIRPEAVLISLDLPHGEGVRLVMRWHTDEALRRLPLAVLLPAEHSAAEFRQQALRAARESELPPSELVRALSERLGEPLQGDDLVANP